MVDTRVTTPIAGFPTDRLRLPSRRVAERRRLADFFVSLVTAAADLTVVQLAYLCAHSLRFSLGDALKAPQYQPWDEYVFLVLAQSVTVVGFFALQGLYRQRRTAPWLDELFRVFVGVSVATAVVNAATPLFGLDYHYSRAALAIGWALSIVGVSVSHQVIHALYGQFRALGAANDAVLIVGTNDIGWRILQTIRQHRSLGYRPVGFLSENGAIEFGGVPVLGSVTSIGAVAREYQIDKVIIGLPGLSNAQLEDLVERCQGAIAAIRVYPDPFQIMTTEPQIEDLGGLPLVAIRESRLKGHNIVLKRSLDLLGSFLLLVAFSPLLIVCAALIKLTSRGPVFFIQERVGLDGRPFKIIKFRTMYTDAEARTGPVWARPDDPRRTPVGAIFRRFSIDELPQLINVLLGEMSLVGPRPERPHFVVEFQQRVPRYFERHHEKAGITGWAQINGMRGACSIEERTQLDLWYVENWTIWLDIKILLKSLVVVLNDPNAY